MKPYEVRFAAPALKQLRDLPRAARELVSAVVAALADNPRPHGCRKLQGYENRWRIRIRGYRVVYQIEDGALLVLVLKIADRKDVYR